MCGLGPEVRPKVRGLDEGAASSFSFLVAVHHVLRAPVTPGGLGFHLHDLVLLDCIFQIQLLIGNVSGYCKHKQTSLVGIVYQDYVGVIRLHLHHAGEL